MNNKTYVLCLLTLSICYANSNSVANSLALLDNQLSKISKATTLIQTTELHEAIKKSVKKLPDELKENNLKQFIKNQKDINSQDEDGNTALHIATTMLNMNSVHNLLAAGINKDIKNKGKKTAADINT